MPTPREQAEAAANAYRVLLINHGAFEGNPGSLQVASEIMPILEALHHVLAGGTASVTVQTNGAANVVQSLEDAFEASMDAMNALSTSDAQILAPTGP